MENDQPEPVLPSFKELRKRARFQAPAPSDFWTDSSEPAIFSSDDDPSVDNYANGRHRKKRRAGTWFQQSQLLSSEAGPVPTATGMRQGLRRELDSGVWLASDDTIDANPKGAGPVHMDPTQRVSNDFNRAASFRNVTPAEAKAQKIIEKCIDEGDEKIDLMNLGLDELASSTVQPLEGFHLIPTVVEGVPFEGGEPRLKLFLGANRLTRIPAAVFDLSCLTVLSLRNNKLVELPPCIAQLRNLEYLNLSFNNLRWLPRELLDLMMPRDNLDNFKLHPNPFCKPEMIRSANREGLLGSAHTRQQRGFELQGPSSARRRENPWGDHGGECSVWTACPVDEEWEKHFQLKRAGACHAARSPVQYIDNTGLNTSSFDLDDGDGLPTENMFAEPAGPPSARLAQVDDSSPALPAPDCPAGPRGLLELSLQACRRAVAANADLRSLMPATTPEHLLRVLALAEERGEADSYRCARPGCKGRSMVVPRTQWVEWWYLGEYTAQRGSVSTSGEPEPRLLTFRAADRDPVPFISRGCSWSCIPSVPEKRLPMGNGDRGTTFLVRPH
ncbi:hypothetical protein GGTG_11917 [Gaeumannomyces tritici R3-111a-1]|uniref:Leucine Rich Repeat domain-containing protein n=1 Tax=Gaeumannomyces tritici (strain R3-111a-1) TaxID=644352 RepID=J3PEI6_GAET3|nr:hypothetical protein GGTG_11917 [Gaeumannomyces tritici R3-111a-1]EJT70894.1 hypothetical protein GGTG_11917 [Gaeumannomyces tritici R3-111a-1]